MFINKKNPNYDLINYNDILDCKKRTEEQIDKEFSRLKKLPCKNNSRAHVGNRIVYHYNFKHLLETRRNNRKDFLLLREIFENAEKKKWWIDYTIKLNCNDKNDYITPSDIYECYRKCMGGIVCFRAITTKYLCNRFNATKVLDFTAGWGGRLLGVRSLDLEYTGIDTNTNLKEGYDKMIKKFGGKMIWNNCLNVDLSKIDYDFVITSPPFVNLEIYENMDIFKSEKEYYAEFLNVMILRCLKHIKNNGSVCINMSKNMYDKHLEYKGIEAIETIDLLKDIGGKENKELIYVFKTPKN